MNQVSGLYVLFQVGSYAFALPKVSLLAFGGALGAMSLVYLMARLRAGRDMTRLLLAGVCVAYMCAAGIMLATYLTDKTVISSVVIWLMGSLATLYPSAAWQIAFVLAPVLVFAVYSHRAMDLLAMGEELAAARGVAVARTIWLSFALVGVLTAIIVANCGPIGFVGLMVPHIARAYLGPRFLPLVLASAMIGAAFLAVCDGVARSLGTFDVPVGVVTNLLGAAFFFYMLATRDVSYATSR
jgi:iron complex transport system permease protein